ncbi:MAG: ComEA family DNA-binding protein [Acidimicrobiales bacterium]
MSTVQRWRSDGRAALEQVGLNGPGRTRLLVLLVTCAVVGVAGALVVQWAAPGAGGTANIEVALPRAVRVTTTRPPPEPLIIHVAGAVNGPGVHRLPTGARVADALAAAGGLTVDADPSLLNLAEPLADGARVHVARQGELNPPPPLSGAGAGGGGTASGSSGPAQPMDLNRAEASQLDELPGVGPATAAAIVAHRTANGPFSSVDALAEVRGIGPAKLEALRPLVRV